MTRGRIVCAPNVLNSRSRSSGGSWSSTSCPYTLTSVLVWDRALADYFEEAVKLAGPGKAQAVGNWITNDLLRELGTARLAIGDSKVRPAHIAALVKLIDSGTVLTNAAKEIFIEMAATGDQPEAIAEKRGLKAAPTDSNELEQWCRDAIAANGKALAEFKAGKDSAINAFKGPVMKAAKGKANPKLVDETLRRLLAAL
jgi:aspartyl-tRNA(Asn)/glutamyl-tRNA(Gln) amidotransferase subunit B